jgi:hypothetical protein
MMMIFSLISAHRTILLEKQSIFLQHVVGVVVATRTTNQKPPVFILVLINLKLVKYAQRRYNSASRLVIEFRSHK